jgi:TetR/AcrR family transcriptional regulator
MPKMRKQEAVGGRRADRSVERIYAAAETEFGRSGLGLTNIDDIAKRARVSKELIYHYFKRKDQLYTETINRFGVSFWNHLLEIDFTQPDALQVVRVFAYRLASFYRDNTHAARFVLDQVFRDGAQFRAERKQVALRTELFGSLTPVLARGAAAGEIDPHMSAPRLFFLAVSVTLGHLAVAGLLASFQLELPELDHQTDPALDVADLVVKLASAANAPRHG